MTGGLMRVRVQTDTNVTTASTFVVAGTDGDVERLGAATVTTTATATGNARLYIWLDDVTTGPVYISAAHGDTIRLCASLHGRHTHGDQPVVSKSYRSPGTG